MARPKDAKIEQCLRRIVKDAAAKDEEITVRKARARAEIELKLSDDFFKEDEEWNKRSREVIRAAIEEESESEESEATPSPKPPTHKASTSASKVTLNGSQPQHNNKTSAVDSNQASAPRNIVDAAVSDSSKVEKRKDVGRSSEHNSSNGEDLWSEDKSTNNRGNHVERHTTLKRPVKTPVQVNGAKRKSPEPKSSEQESGSEEDSSEESERDSDEPHQKKARTATPSSAEGAPVDESEGDLSDKHGRVNKPASPEGGAESVAPPSVPPIPAKAYKPPPGYAALDPERLVNDSAFTQSSLNGKQIWHITAPSNVPLSSITEVALDAIQSGQPVLTHKGVEYLLNEDSTQSNDTAAMLIPGVDGYQRLDQPIARTLRLRQKIALPNLSIRQADQSTGSSAAANIGEAAVRSVRPQPKGLRMRYRPPGFGSGKVGRVGSGSDSSDEDERPTTGPAFQFPKALGGHETVIAQGASARSTDANSEVNTKKLKKKRKDKHVSESVDESVNHLINGIATPGSGSPAATKGNRGSFSPDVSKSTSATTSLQKIVGDEEPLMNGAAVKAPSKEERRRLRLEGKQAKQKAK